MKSHWCQPPTLSATVASHRRRRGSSLAPLLTPSHTSEKLARYRRRGGLQQRPLICDHAYGACGRTAVHPSGEPHSGGIRSWENRCCSVGLCHPSRVPTCAREG